MVFITNLEITFRRIFLRELQYKTSYFKLQHFSYNLLTNVQNIFYIKPLYFCLLLKNVNKII